MSERDGEKKRKRQGAEGLVMNNKLNQSAINLLIDCKCYCLGQRGVKLRGEVMMKLQGVF